MRPLDITEKKIVLKAQELGLNTCWVALSHGKSNANIGRGEKQVCIIAVGYGKSNGFPHKNKSMKKAVQLQRRFARLVHQGYGRRYAGADCTESAKVLY